MKYTRSVLDNGIRLITVPMKGNPTVTVSITANVGSRFEDLDENGISHFLEHMLFKGTESRSTKEITLELDNIGASYNAYTNSEQTTYHAKSSKKHFDKVLKILSDMYVNSNFPEEELERERGVILEEINMQEDNPRRKVYDLFKNIMYLNHPYGRNNLGSKKNVSSFKQEDFVDYRDKHYVGKNTIVVVAGDLKNSEVKKSVVEILGDIDAGKISKPLKIKKDTRGIVCDVDYKKLDQTHMIMGFKTFGIKHKDVIPLAVLRGVLSSGMSSRLFSKMREELGICYYIGASNMYTFEDGFQAIFSGVGNDRVGEAITGILDILKDTRDNGVGDKELNKVKRMLVSKTLMGLETTEDFTDFYNDQETLFEELQTPQQIIKEIKSVTAKDVQRLAKKIYKKDNIRLAIHGPHRDANKFKKLLKI